MLNWLKRTTHSDWAVAPVPHDGETLIDASAHDIFEHLDLASPRNALRARGFVFGPGNPSYNIYELTDPRIPDLTHIMEVTESIPGERYCLRTSFEGPESLCALLESSSEYTITPHAEGGHVLHLAETNVMQPGLTRNQYVLERANLSFSVFRNLTRLKLQIELGADAAYFTQVK